MERLDVHLLGRFEVLVDGEAIPQGAFAHRRAADLVKLLALAPGHRANRDRVIELLWPQLGADAGAANLHKAAHYARRALGAPGAVVLRQGLVLLAPEAAVTTDVERFEAGDADAYAGELLPDDRYEEWTLAARERLRARRLADLRSQDRWHEVLAEDPADEQAHRELMRSHLAAGDRLAAARQFRLLGDELARLGLQPSRETLELHRRLFEGPAVRAGRLLDSPVIGRDGELSHAVRALRRAAEGRGVTLLVTGEAGMGKTRYVEAALSGAERRGWHTLRGRARGGEGGGGTPYQPIAEALDPLLGERPDLVARLSPGARAALSVLSPAAPDPGDGGPVALHRVLAAAGHLLREAALDRGVLLAVEDLQAADAATLELIEFLASNARREPLVLVVTARPGAADAPATRLRANLLEQRAATEVTLGPLPGDAVGRIASAAAGRALPEQTAAAIVAAAAGNPFYAEELGRAVDPAGRVRVPDHLHELLDARLVRLPGPVVEVLPIFAVLGDGFATAELAAVARLPVPEAEARLEQAGEILEEGAEGWRFKHPLLREAARRRAPASQLARAHGDAATQLAAGGGAPDRIAHHLIEAGRGAEAVPHLAAAARHAAAVGAYADGRRWVEQALARAGDQDTAELYALLGDLRFATGDRAALPAYAAAVRRAGEEQGRDIKVREARAAIAFGELDAAERALAGLPAGTVLQRAGATVVLAMLAWHRGQLEEASRLIDQAGALADAAGEPVHMLHDVRAMIAHTRGRWESHARWELGEVWDMPQLAGRVFDAYLCVTEYVLHAGNPYERLIRFAGDLRRQAREAGARRGEAFGATVLGEALLLAGEPEAAREQLDEAARMSREVGAVGGEALARARLAEALFALADGPGARANAEEALELAHASTLAHHLLFLVHAPLLRVQEDLDVALALVAESERLLDGFHSCNFCPVSYALAAASVCARTGDAARAEAFLARAEDSAHLWPPGVWTPAVCEVRGEIRGAQGDRDAAAVVLRRAVEGYAAAGQRLNEARARAAIAALS